MGSGYEIDIIGRVNESSTKFEVVSDMLKQPAIRMKVEKALANYNSSASTHLPPNTPGAFIHIGKTGGSTLSRLLRNGCHSHVPKPCLNETLLPASHESVISKSTTYYHIPDFENGNLKKYDYHFYAITIRDPLSRAISVFRSTHPFRKAQEKLEEAKTENIHLYRFYKEMYPDSELPIYRRIVRVKQWNVGKVYKCFDTLEEYAQLLANFTDYKEDSWEFYLEQKDCANLAKTMLHHMSPGMMNHNFYDLRGVLSQVQNITQKTLLLLRTEFLWQDWASANQWLGDENEIFTNPKSLRNSTEIKTIPFNSSLSDEGRENLCYALEEEYRVYLRLLVLSVNLSERDIANSLTTARENCPCLDLKLPNKYTPTAVVPSKGDPVWYL